MRKLFLVGTSVLLLSFGASSAKAFTPYDQSAYTALSQQAYAADPVIERVEELPVVYESGAYAGAPGGKSVLAAIEAFLRNAALLAVSAFVVAVGAVGVRTIWLREQMEYPTAEVMDQSVKFSHEPQKQRCA